MTLPELYQILLSAGLPVAYDHFEDTKENPIPAPPFIIYKFATSADLMADDINYLDISNYQVELYTLKKDSTREKLVEDLFKTKSLPYSKTGVWLATERMYQTVYEIQLIGG